MNTELCKRGHPSKHIAACIALICALMLPALLCACMKKDMIPSNASTVQRKLESYRAETALYTGADAPDGPGTEKATTRLAFRSGEARWQGTFWEFATVAGACECLDAISDAHEISYSRNTGGNYQILEYTEAAGNGRMFWRVTRVESTILAIGYPAEDDKAENAAGKLRVALGY